MERWVTRVSRALMMGVFWALAWMPIGLGIGLVVDPDGRMDEPWIAVGAYPGFMSGVVFAAIVGFAASSRPVGQLPLSLAALRGATSGLIVGALWFALVLVSGPPYNAIPLAPIAIVAMALLGAVTGAASKLIAKASAKGAGASAT